MEKIVYILSAVMSLVCTFMLFRGYQRNRARILLWSALCFTGMTLNNAMLFVDLVLYPNVDMAIARNVPTLAGLLLLLYGLVWDVS